MSTQLKEKQQTKSKEQVPTRELQADYHFNQHIFRTVAYTAAGFGFGMLSSILFKHKAGMTIFFAGAGAGYGSADFVNDLNRFRNQRGPTQLKREGGASSQIREKLDRTADNLKGDLQQAKNKVERGVEDVSSKVAGQIGQTARGAEEWARNASEKASQHFQSKDYRRGGDDDKDKDDTKSGKKETQRKDDSSLKKDVKDKVNQFTKEKPDDSSLTKNVKDKVKEFTKDDSSKKDQKKDDSSLKKDVKDKVNQLTKEKPDDSSLTKNVKDQVKQFTNKDQSKDQKKDDSSKKDQKKDDTQRKDQSKDKTGEKTSFNKTVKGGETPEAKREEGSKEHRLIGDLRADQYTSKIPDDTAFQGYKTATPEKEGPVKVKREDKSSGGQGKSSADENRTVNKGGQHFQDFRSNPNQVGKGGELHDLKQDYQRNRNKATDAEADEKRRRTKHLEQDIHGESVKQGNNIRVNMESETKQGFQNYRTGVAPGLQKNQVNAKLE